VPATSSCYPDNFDEQVDKARAALTADVAKQKATNEELRKKLRAIEPMEQAKRTQEFLMKDPQRGMKVMQEIQQSGTTASGPETLAAAKQVGELERGLPKLFADFKAAIDKAKAPVHAEQDAWFKAKATLQGEGGEGFATLADFNHYADLIRKENAEYERVCASYYGPMGVFTQWLAGYKAALLKTSEAEAAGDRGFALNLEMMGISGGYRSEATYNAVGNYLTQLSRVYRERIVKREPGEFTAVLKSKAR
jgi:hypothetical protein